MYASVYELRFWPHVTDEEISALYDRMMRWFSAKPGFLGAALLVNEGAGDTLVLTYWTDCTLAHFACGAHMLEFARYANPITCTSPAISGYTVATQTPGTTAQAQSGARCPNLNPPGSLTWSQRPRGWDVSLAKA